MKITKYEHACLVIEESGKRLVIDPGDFSVSLPKLDNVVAVVVTHVHFDHLNKDRLNGILAANPNAKLYSVQAVKDELPQVELCKPGDTKNDGPFKLEFFGGYHAVIHDDYPKFENIGVFVNDAFYYGGDSLTQPNKPVKLLAVPASGPWAKTGEEMDFLVAVRPEVAFPTHDSLNSDVGNKAQDYWLGSYADKNKIQYKRLSIGESIEI